MTFAVDGDFTDPLSYVASLRVDALRTGRRPCPAPAPRCRWMDRPGLRPGWWES